MHDQPQQEYKVEHKTDNSGGKVSSNLLKNIKSLKTHNHYQPLLTKIVMFSQFGTSKIRKKIKL